MFLAAAAGSDGTKWTAYDVQFYFAGRQSRVGKDRVVAGISNFIIFINKTYKIKMKA